MERKAVNVYKDTRELLNKVKDEFHFKSDDQAVKFLCKLFLSDERRIDLLKIYIETKTKAGE